MLDVNLAKLQCPNCKSIGLDINASIRHLYYCHNCHMDIGLEYNELKAYE